MSEELIVGLDIGTTKICALVGRKNEFGKIELIGKGQAESHGVSQGVVSNIDDTVTSIINAVSQASEAASVEIKEVYVGIAGQHIKSLQHTGMLMRKNPEDEIRKSDIKTIVDDLYRLAMQPGEEIIHVIPQEYNVDNDKGLKNPVGMTGARLEASCHIVTGLISAAKNIQRCVSRAGLIPVGLILEPLASSDAVLSSEEKEAGVVLVDIGGGTTDLAIFQDGIIRHTAVIPYGGNIITKDIHEGCKIIKSQAEMVKVKFGSAMASMADEMKIVSIPGLNGRAPKEVSLKNLANIIQARMEEIFEQVYYEIKASGWEKKIILGAVLTGGGSQLQHIQHLFQYVTGMQSRIGLPHQHLGKDTKEIQHPMYATGVGLVIKGFAESSSGFNTNQNKQDEVVENKKGKWFENFFKKPIIKAIFDDDDDKDLK